VYNYFHTGRRFWRGENQHQQNGTAKNDSSGKWKGKGGKKSKQRRKLSRAPKQQQYKKEQAALQALRQSESVRKREKQSTCEQTHAVVREDSSSNLHPTFQLPQSANNTDKTTERMATMFTHTDTTIVRETIFDKLRMNEKHTDNITDNNVVSNILQEVYNDNEEDDVMFETTTNHVEVIEQTETEQIEYEQLQKQWTQRYYRRNPDNNKKKFATLQIENEVMNNNFYNFSNDNPYLSKLYEKEQKLIDLVQQENDERTEATNQYNKNQIEARRKERSQQNPLVELTTLTTAQKEENKRFRDDHVERMIQNKSRKRQKRLDE
jgi:hypothetical protein